MHDSAPSSPNGIKLELFIFDTFPFAAKFRVLEGTRGDDFAPVKNASGKDSPESARELLLKRDRRWLPRALPLVRGRSRWRRRYPTTAKVEAFAGATVAPGLISSAPAAFSPACFVAVVAVLGALVLTSTVDFSLGAGRALEESRSANRQAELRGISLNFGELSCSQREEETGGAEEGAQGSGSSLSGVAAGSHGRLAVRRQSPAHAAAEKDSQPPLLP